MKNWNKSSNRFLARLSGICFADGDAGGGEGGSEGGGGGAPSSGSSTPAPSSSGGASPEAFDYGNSFSGGGARREPSSERIGEILAKEGDDKHTLNGDDIRDFLAFTPTFGKPKPAESATPAKVGDPPVDPNAPKLDANGQPVVDPAKPAEPQLSGDAKAIVDALTNAAKTPAPQQQTQQQQPQQPQQPKNFYGDLKPPMSVNPNLVRDLVGLEANAPIPPQVQRAVDTLIGGVMNTVMRDVAALMIAERGAQMAQVPQVVQGQITGQQAVNKFYESYKELNKPGLYAVIDNIAAAIEKAEGPQDRGSDAFIKKLGEATHNYIKNQLGVELPRAAAPQVQTAPVQTQQATKPPQKRLPFATHGGSRSSADPRLNGQSGNPLIDFVI